MNTIRSTWIGWNDGDKCPLCLREGKGIANVYKKGHSRGNGIILETGLSYCEECANTSECEAHWKKWWAEQWKESEEYAEKNWQEKGMYTNMGGWAFSFAYAKTPKGLEPYTEVFPDCPRYKLERLITRAKYKIGLTISEKRRLVADLIVASDAPEDFKEAMIKDAEDAFKFVFYCEE